jgi:hypothetical protein
MWIIPADTVLSGIPIRSITGIQIWRLWWPRPSNSKMSRIMITDDPIMKMFTLEMKNCIYHILSCPVLLEKCFFYIHSHALKSCNKAVLKEFRVAFSINYVIQEDWSDNSNR